MGANENRLEFLKQIAQQLVFHSARFEPFIPTDRGSFADQLALLGSLEKFARASLSGLLEPPVSTSTPGQTPETIRPSSQMSASGSSPSKMPGAGRASAPGMPPAPVSNRYGSARNEYRPALSDPSLVQALLQLQRRSQSRRSSTTLIKAKPAPAPAPVQETDATFSFERLPHVEARPKASSLFRTAVAPTQPVLRPETS